jgi:hypothetical protein
MLDILMTKYFVMYAIPGSRAVHRVGPMMDNGCSSFLSRVRISFQLS